MPTQTMDGVAVASAATGDTRDESVAVGATTAGSTTAGSPEGRAAPGEPALGEPAPGSTTPGAAAPGEPAAGKTTAGNTTPGEATAGEAAPGEATAGEAAPGSTAAWSAVGTAAPGSTTMESSAMVRSQPLPEALHGGLGQTLVQMGGAVVLVVTLILVLQRLANRYRAGWSGKGRDGGIEIVSQRALGNRLSLVVVETHGRKLLLGTSPQGVTSLASLGDAATSAGDPAWSGGVSPTVGSSTAFRSADPAPGVLGIWKRFLGGRGRREETVESWATEGSNSSLSMPTPASTPSAEMHTISQKAETPASARSADTRDTRASARSADTRDTRASARSADTRDTRTSAHGAKGNLLSAAARAVSRRPDNVPRSALADLEEASRIAKDAREREERAAQESTVAGVDAHEFESQFREKLRAIREKYPTLEQVEGRRA